MECIDLSDLEEGEIFECEPYSPITPMKFEKIQKNGKIFEEKEFKAQILKYPKHDFGIPKHNSKPKDFKILKKAEKNITYELDDILSSDEDSKYSCKKPKALHKDEKSRKAFDYSAYGAAEDIMSQIGETISRKSRCNYKRRRSKELKHAYELVGHRKVKEIDEQSFALFSSHYSNNVKRRKHDSDSEIDSCDKFYKDSLPKNSKKRKKKKKKEIIVDSDSDDGIEIISPSKISKKKVVDFDEMRKNLLEKLKKQKEEEEMKKSTQEVENTDIQEVEMIIECTNYVDKVPENLDEKEGSIKEPVCENLSDDEDVDLMKLRSMALASKEKRKALENSPKPLQNDNTEEKKQEVSKSENNEEDDLDRNELLLRAEALKTALLKKHQKRLNKIKQEKPNNDEIADNQAGSLPTSPLSSNETSETNSPLKEKEVEEDPRPANEIDDISNGFECGLDKENINENTDNEKVVSFTKTGQELEEQKQESIESADLKKACLKPRIKKKKRKSLSIDGTKEKNEIVEEDDKTLRFQLLTDLIKKKSQKASEKKPILIDSAQTSVNTHVENSLKQDGNKKPLALLKSSSFKKFTENKLKKPIVVPKPEIKRIIVHVGPDESDSDEEDSEVFSSPNSKSENVIEEKEKVPNNGANTPIAANYEKSVDLLLSRAREKIEGEMKKANNDLLTPEAVYKHLPPSQRLEYIRLKQKIAEREKLKKLRTENETALSAPIRNSKPSALKNVSTNPIKEQTQPTQNFNASKTPLHRKTLNSLEVNNGLKKQPIKISSTKKFVSPVKTKGNLQNSFSTSSNQTTLTKLKLLLKKIKIEKTIEENYEKEIVKLKNQLSIFEKKKSEQQFKIKKLAEESMKIFKSMQPKQNQKDLEVKKEDNKELKVEKEEKEESKVEEKEETKVEEKEENKVEKEETPIKTSEEKLVEKESLKEEVKEKEETKRERIENEKDKEVIKSTISETKCVGTELVEYCSPLQVFSKATEETNRVDPNVIMCHFDLVGICKDEECPYQHVRK